MDGQNVKHKEYLKLSEKGQSSMNLVYMTVGNASFIIGIAFWCNGNVNRLTGGPITSVAVEA